MIADDIASIREGLRKLAQAKVQAEAEAAKRAEADAKPADLPYGPDQRLMTKVKHVRTADCVVAGFRWHKSGPIVGSPATACGERCSCAGRTRLAWCSRCSR